MSSICQATGNLHGKLELAPGGIEGQTRQMMKKYRPRPEHQQSVVRRRVQMHRDAGRHGEMGGVQQRLRHLFPSAQTAQPVPRSARKASRWAPRWKGNAARGWGINKWSTGRGKCRSGTRVSRMWDTTMPYFAAQVPEAERTKRLFHDKRSLRFDDEHFFIRCILYLPIEETEESFVWACGAR